MAGSPIDDQIEAILSKYDLWDPEQYTNAVAELVSYLLTVDPKEEARSLYYKSAREKIHLENCLIRSHD